MIFWLVRGSMGDWNVRASKTPVMIFNERYLRQSLRSWKQNSSVLFYETIEDN